MTNHSIEIYDDLMKQLDDSQSCYSCQEEPNAQSSRHESSSFDLEPKQVNGQIVYTTEQLQKLGVAHLLPQTNHSNKGNSKLGASKEVTPSDFQQKLNDDMLHTDTQMADDTSEQQNEQLPEQEEVPLEIDLEKSYVPCIYECRHREFKQEMLTQHEDEESNSEMARQNCPLVDKDQNKEQADNCQDKPLPQSASTNVTDTQLHSNTDALKNIIKQQKEYDYRVNQLDECQSQLIENRIQAVDQEVQIQSHSSEISATSVIDPHISLNNYLQPIFTKQISEYLCNRLEYLRTLSLEQDETDQFKKSVDEFFTATLSSSIAYLDSHEGITSSFTKEDPTQSAECNQSADKIEQILCDFQTKHKMLKVKSKGKTKTFILMILLQRYCLLVGRARLTKVTESSNATGKAEADVSPQTKAAELRARKQLQRLEKHIKETLNQMQLEVDIQRLGSASLDQSDGKTAEHVFEDTLRWSVLSIFGDKLASFLNDTFLELQIGSDAFMKDVKALGKKTRKPSRRMTTQHGVSMLQDRSASGRKTPTRANILEDGITKSPKGSARKKKQTSTQKNQSIRLPDKIESTIELPIIPSSGVGIAGTKRDSDLKLFGKPSPLAGRDSNIEQAAGQAAWQAPFNNPPLDGFDSIFNQSSVAVSPLLPGPSCYQSLQHPEGTVSLETMMKTNHAQQTMSTMVDEPEDLIGLKYQPKTKRQRLEKMINHDSLRLGGTKKVQSTMPQLFKQNSDQPQTVDKVSYNPLIPSSASPALAVTTTGLANSSANGTPLPGAPSKQGFPNVLRKPSAARKFKASTITTHSVRNTQLYTATQMSSTSLNAVIPTKCSNKVNSLLLAESREGRKAMGQSNVMQRWRSKKLASKEASKECQQLGDANQGSKSKQNGEQQAFMRKNILENFNI